MSRPSASERWRELLRRQAESGWSVAEFCRRRDVSEASFYQWRKRLRADPLSAAATGRSSPGPFLPLAVVGAAGVEIELPCGAMVRIPLGDQRTLEQVITLLIKQEAAGP
ncbi:MAG: transposase [Pirellulaceae bacterium]